MCPSTAPQPLRAGALLLCLLFSSVALGESVSLTLPGGRVALGDYRPGDPAQPALLLLHGFLQTHNFGIIQSLANELSDAHYTVLAPTLTLGIDQRRQSLPCDAIQNHRLADGTQELAGWVQWLKSRGHQRVVVIGHSSGAMRVLLYANTAAQEPALAGAVLISMASLGDKLHPEATRPDQSRAQAMIAAGDETLQRYHLGFCDGNYLAPPDAYLSYSEADDETLLSALRALPHPVVTIFGDADKNLPVGWIEDVAATGRHVKVVKGAGHFYSGGHEFDLQDALLDALSTVEPSLPETDSR